MHYLGFHKKDCVRYRVIIAFSLSYKAKQQNLLIDSQIAKKDFIYLLIIQWTGKISRQFAMYLKPKSYACIMNLPTKIDMQLLCHSSNFSPVQVSVSIGTHNRDLHFVCFSTENSSNFAKEKLL